MLDSFLNAWISYRILLTMSITIGLVERSFSRLKGVKSYIRLTILQKKLSGLAIIY